jgi:transposase
MQGWYWTPQQRQALYLALRRTREAGLLRRLLALWHLDQGCSVAEVAEWLLVDRSSVYRWMERFAATGSVEALEDQRGQGAPLHWDKQCQQLLKRALAKTPIQLGYPANRWNVPVLQAFFEIFQPQCALSVSTMRRRLKALEYAWKRFRHTLPPDPEAEKKTPASAPDPRLARKHSPFGRG